MDQDHPQSEQQSKQQHLLTINPTTTTPASTSTSDATSTNDNLPLQHQPETHNAALIDDPQNHDNAAAKSMTTSTSSTNTTMNAAADSGGVIGIPFGKNYYYPLSHHYDYQPHLQPYDGFNLQHDRYDATTIADRTQDDEHEKEQRQPQHHSHEQQQQQRSEKHQLPILHLPWNIAYTYLNNTENDSTVPTEEEQIQHQQQPISAACSSQATIVVSPIDGSIYQVGTMHGIVYRDWKKIDIVQSCLIPTLQQQQQRSLSSTQIQPKYVCCQVSAGRHYCLARINHGTMVVSWGAGHFGQLGVVITSTTTTTRTSSSSNNTNRNIQQSAPRTQQQQDNQGEASESSSDNDDSDTNGELDNSSNQTTTSVKCISYTSKPVLIERLLPIVTGGTPIIDIAAGDWHALALTESGHVWSWGLNHSLQCGIPFHNNNKDDKNNTHNNNAPPSSTNALGSLALPLPIPGIPPMKQIAAGRAHSCALTAGSGKVYCWGNAHLGQCGTGSTIRRSVKGILPTPVQGLPSSLEMVQITAAGNHCISLSKAGRVFTWGDGREGQLGFSIMNSTSRYTSLQDLYSNKPRLVADVDFVSVEASHNSHIAKATDTSSTVEVTETGTAGPISSQMRSPAQVLSRTPKIVSVYASDTGSAAISSSGHVYCWGSNDVEQLGIPTPMDIPHEDVVSESDVAASSNDPVSMQQHQQPRPLFTGNRAVHMQTFDSDHNVLLPLRVTALDDYFVHSLTMGPNHMVCFGALRTSEESMMMIGRTLHEAQSGEPIEVPSLKQKHTPYGMNSRKLYHPIATRVLRNEGDTIQLKSIDSRVNTITGTNVVSPSSSPMHASDKLLQSNTDKVMTIADTSSSFHQNGTTSIEKNQPVGEEQHRRRFTFGLFRSLRQSQRQQSLTSSTLTQTTTAKTAQQRASGRAFIYRSRRRRNCHIENDIDNEPSIGTI